ncbi:16S rRNA (adenine(1518)-N(6)/adenine(1519)-N(6))-dimethyltransferase RsmA [Natronospira bacteriovora]|uniref:Ribosomal RNA small subunit methyltransferase A n=1 Tax=Natronospira bacteriovora TaxID=3069753 RepID=A0ABU0W427_9GAMM|nr:16S rRNA (adenine(1518)-N(6)/adenine(1519)-N(6))-dimethyltransferase RsmA [Natronospira sp. AB-CW4]MDQ2068772.1 16S rRNA (adenine(1518)-N(6)/adenine(1519)-N(6))-dimethyltransferase RsmA [Natronospira sp. AB-CW4]
MNEHRARKRFGQHFLHDRNIIGRIVDVIDPKPGDRLLEIGPGLGAISGPLMERHGDLDVVEIDRDVIPHLQEKCAGLGELRVHNVDALKFRLDSLGPGPWRVVGNLPYNISTPLMFHLFSQISAITDMHFMLQKEVVDRLVAEPGTSDYGRLGIMSALYCEAEHLFDVPPGAFSPRPKVQSSIVRLRPRATPICPADHQEVLAQLVRQAFSRRRKTLRNALKGLVNADTVEQLGIDPGARPETLPPEAFAKLAERVVAG